MLAPGRRRTTSLVVLSWAVKWTIMCFPITREAKQHSSWLISCFLPVRGLDHLYDGFHQLCVACLRSPRCALCHAPVLPLPTCLHICNMFGWFPASLARKRWLRSGRMMGERVRSQAGNTPSGRTIWAFCCGGENVSRVSSSIILFQSRAGIFLLLPLYRHIFLIQEPDLSTQQQSPAVSSSHQPQCVCLSPCFP